jgi:hypothetical protein
LLFWGSDCCFLGERWSNFVGAGVGLAFVRACILPYICHYFHKIPVLSGFRNHLGESQYQELKKNFFFNSSPFCLPSFMLLPTLLSYYPDFSSSSTLFFFFASILSLLQ